MSTKSSTITLDWKATAITASILFVTSALVARLLSPGAAPLKLNIGGKYSASVHAIVIALVVSGVYVGMLYAYSPIASLFTGDSLYQYGYSQSQCGSCPSTLPPAPKVEQNFAALPADSEGADCYIGAYSGGANYCNGNCH